MKTLYAPGTIDSALSTARAALLDNGGAAYALLVIATALVAVWLARQF